MKKIIYLYLLGILNICHVTFAMDIDKSLKMAEDYANKHKWKDAFDIIDKLKAKNIRKAWAVEIQIKRQKADWEKKQEPTAQKWIFIKQTPGAESTKKTDWQIKDQKLFFNLDTTEVLSQQSFAELIKEAKDKSLPFILIMAQSIFVTQSNFKNFFPYFFSADIMTTYVPSLSIDIYNPNTIENPVTREKVTNIEIYVMGDDGMLRLLKDIEINNMNYLEEFTYLKLSTPEEISKGIYDHMELKPELEKPGIAQVFIADLYKKQEQPSKPELQQLERLWLSWALPKFAPEDAVQKDQATQRMDAIPNRPELVSKKVEIIVEPPVQPVQPPPTQPTEPASPKVLFSMLQNLTNKLRQVAVKLKQL